MKFAITIVREKTNSLYNISCHETAPVRKCFIMCLNKRLISVAFLLIIVSVVCSQQNSSSIHFESGQHNWGRINEADGPFKHEFVFTNKGDDPLHVINIRAGAGLTVWWTKNQIHPGDTGTVSVKFNPHNMPGKFNRTITLTATGDPSSATLRLLGEVIPREKTTEELYPHQAGQLRMRTNHISIGNITPGSVKKGLTYVINNSEEVIDVAFADIPGHIKPAAIPQLLQPGETGVLKALWDAGHNEDWGVVTHSFRLIINGNSPPGNILYLSVNIQEDFSVMSDQEKENAPSIFFDERVFNFGTLSHGKSVEHGFVFTNKGKSELVIRSVRSGCGFTEIDLQKEFLKPGESGTIKAVFNSRGLHGRQSRGITVISNDPANPSIVLRITGEIISE